MSNDDTAVCWACSGEVTPQTHPNGERTCPECDAPDPDTGGKLIADGGVENGAQRIDWLHRNGQAVHAETHQQEESDSWRAAVDENMELLSADGQGVTRVDTESDESPYLTVISEWNDTLAGACECDDYQYRGGACKHLLFRVQMAAIGSHSFIQSKGLWETLVQAESGDTDTDNASNLTQTTPAVETASDSGETGTEVVDDTDDAPAPPEPEPATQASDSVDTFDDAGAFATSMPEVDDKYAIQMNGETYIRKAGYARLLRQQSWSVKNVEVVGAHETEWTRAKYRATITDENGEAIASSVGTAGPPDKEDMADAEMHLDELAETRAWTRAASIATGEGMTALVEVDGGDL